MQGRRIGGATRSQASALILTVTALLCACRTRTLFALTVGITVLRIGIRMATTALQRRAAGTTAKNIFLELVKAIQTTRRVALISTVGLKTASEKLHITMSTESISHHF